MSKSRENSQLENIASLLTSVIPKKTTPAKPPKQGRRFPLPTDTAFDNPQLSLFQRFLCNTEEQQDALSNAVDLWDSVPKYCVSHQEMKKLRIDGKFLEPYEKTFQHRQRTFTMTVQAARVKDDDGQSRDYYPSATEELIEEALRKLATEQQAGYFDAPQNRSGVVFTLYALRQEMEKRGHTRSFQQIVRSLHIMAGSVIEIKTEGGGEGFDKSPYLPRLSAVSRSKLKDNPDAKWLVQFHPLVTISIDRLDYRQFNYALMMSHSAQLTRWLHKQLVLKFTFADYTKRFEMRASTIVRDSGLLGYTRHRDNIDALDKAFGELEEQGVISNYKRQDETGLRGKLLDVVFTVSPHLDFIREAKAANKRRSDAQSG